MALDYRQSLSVMDKVGKNTNLSFLRYSGAIGAWGGRLGYFGAATSLYLSTDSYLNNDISGAQYSWNVSSTSIPTAVGGSGPGILVGSFFMAINEGKKAIETAFRSFSFDFSSYNIQKGFSMF